MYPRSIVLPRVFLLVLPLVLLLLFAMPVGAAKAKVKLYLKEGGNLIVTEYEVLEDRVRYYSVERSAWEEIPLELVDLERTQRVQEEQAKERQERQRDSQIEQEAERRARTELHKVPIEDGVYYLDEEQVVPVQQAEVIINGDKKRTLLQVLSPIPLLGKSTMEVQGTSSKLVVKQSRPMLYVRLEKLSRFGIVQMTVKKENRVAQVVQTIPKTTEMIEEQQEVEVFRQQMAHNVYKVWPVEPLPPGEYAFIDFTPGEGNIRIWDFSCQPSSASAPTAAEPRPR
jgi:hypothetical protein